MSSKADRVIDAIDGCGLAFLIGLIVGVVTAVIATAVTYSEDSFGGLHHRNAYDSHGNLTCEFCKALSTRGEKDSGK